MHEKIVHDGDDTFIEQVLDEGDIRCSCGKIVPEELAVECDICHGVFCGDCIATMERACAHVCNGCLQDLIIERGSTNDA